MVDKKVTIIGLGLIGGSLARAFKEKLGIQEIIGVNRNAESLNRALNDGTIVRGYSQICEDVYSSDLIFICTPVKRTMEFISSLAGRVKSNCILTDVGSTKGEIIDFINKMPNPPCFVGGHPMAGTEKTGYKSGFSHLFENAYYILSPSKSSTEYSISLLTEMVKGIGAISVAIDANEHDMITACISHVPHIIASALVNLVKCKETSDSKMQLLAAGGFKDMTRIASSSPEMWENIVSSNSTQIKGILKAYVEVINEFSEYVDKNDSKSIYNFFESSKTYRDSIVSSKKSLIEPIFEVIIDVVDKPGIIAEIATLLGKKSINIKNINVSNSRELEQGCLKITLPDFDSVDTSYDLLTKSGYKVYK